MRKTIITIAAALVVSASAFAQANWEFGLKGGIALNNMPRTTVSHQYEKVVANIGFQGGVYAALDLSDLMVGQLEVLYSRKGVSTIDHTVELIGGTANKYSRNIHYLQIPVLFGPSLAGGRLRVLVGPELGIYLGNEIKANYWDPVFDNDYYGINPLNFAIGLQATYFIIENLGIELKGDFGVTNTFKKATEDKGKNMAVQLGICYRFNFR